jgi:intracellular multiplication protein IcmO
MVMRQRGLDQDQEQVSAMLIRDTRTLGQRVVDFFKKPANVSVVLLSLAIGCYILTALADAMLLIGIVMFFVTKSTHEMLPFRLPKRAKCKDYNNLIAGTNLPGKAEGIYYFGNDKKNEDELWFTNEDMRTHVLIFGSTGSGKTELLVGLAYNALLQSSGFIYVDGKGDNSLFAKIFSLARYMGREDDVLLINFMTGARDIIGPQEKRLSNTLNPFSSGSSSMLSQLIVSLMDSASDKAESDMWKGRAIAFVEALMKILVAMRDAGHILLDANTIRQYFVLERLEAMVSDKVFIRDGKDPISLEGVPDVVIEPIANYLINLPGYNKEKKGKQVSQVFEQHGFITMQLTRVFTSLADTYGHILRTNLPEVDLRDVVLNRRLLVTLLPALEKAPDELANLGKIIIASLKTMMAAGLGEEVEGLYTKVIDRKPTNARNPFLCILDEYGYYAVPGFAIVPAQARSLGFSVVFAGQDLPALQKASKEEAATIGANTNIKLCMKLEDPLETWEFFMKTAGESYVSHVGGFQTDTRSVTSQYMDTKSAQLEKRQRVDLLDLKEQGLGETHIFFKSRIVRARVFYANPKPIKEMRLNQFVKVDVPSDAVLRNLINGFYSFRRLNNLRKGEMYGGLQAQDDDAKSLVDILSSQSATAPIERGISSLLAYHERTLAPSHKVEEEIELPMGELDVFTKLRLTEYLKDLILVKDLTSFGLPLLAQTATRERLAYAERISGKSEQYSTNIANEIIKDMQTATHYPPTIASKPYAYELVQSINDVIAEIVVKKKAQETKDAATTAASSGGVATTTTTTTTTTT